jgi:hypothetical protein
MEVAMMVMSFILIGEVCFDRFWGCKSRMETNNEENMPTPRVQCDFMSFEKAVEVDSG